MDATYTGNEQHPPNDEDLLTRLTRLLERAERATLDEWLTVDEAAKALNVSKKWIYKEANNLPWLKRVNQRFWRASRKGLEKWMASQP